MTRIGASSPSLKFSNRQPSNKKPDEFFKYNHTSPPLTSWKCLGEVNAAISSIIIPGSTPVNFKDSSLQGGDGTTEEIVTTWKSSTLVISLALINIPYYSTLFLSRTGRSPFPPLRPRRHHPGKTSARPRRVPTRLNRGCRPLSRAAWERATLSVPFAVIRTGTSLKNRLARHSASLSDCSGRRAPVFDGSPLVLLPSSAGQARGRRARRFIRIMSSLTFFMHVTTLTCRW